MSDNKNLNVKINVLIVFVIIETILLLVLLLKPDTIDLPMTATKVKADFTEKYLDLEITFDGLKDDNIDIMLVDANVEDKVYKGKLTCDSALCEVTFEDIYDGAIRKEYDVYIDVISFMSHHSYYLGNLHIDYSNKGYVFDHQ